MFSRNKIMFFSKRLCMYETGTFFSGWIIIINKILSDYVILNPYYGLAEIVGIQYLIADDVVSLIYVLSDVRKT